MLNEILGLTGYIMSKEYFRYPTFDGTFSKQSKFAVEVFFNPFQFTFQKRKNGIGKTINIQKEVGDEYTID